MVYLVGFKTHSVQNSIESTLRRILLTKKNFEWEVLSRSIIWWKQT